MGFQSSRVKRTILGILGLVLSLVLGIGSSHPAGGQALPIAPPEPSGASPNTVLATDALPPPQRHPLPTSLDRWIENPDEGDYFSEIQTTPVGYLLWTQFPVRVYVDPGSQNSEPWLRAVSQAIVDWSQYFPLEQVAQADTADITVRPFLLAIQRDAEGKLMRVRSAETRYTFLRQPQADGSSRLIHQMAIDLRPNQTPDYLQAAARHELGHALGIWGHSPLQTDALYFSQVRTPPPISRRDINTLKRIYQQPTRLGWPLSP